MEEVDLIVSGYKWGCPNCSKFNKEIAAKDKVICGKCKKKYRVTEATHTFY